jgi:hypothetical protein
VFVAASERTLRYQDIAALNDGDYFLDGKLFDKDGNLRSANTPMTASTPDADRAALKATRQTSDSSA